MEIFAFALTLDKCENQHIWRYDISSRDACENKNIIFFFIIQYTIVEKYKEQRSSEENGIDKHWYLHENAKRKKSKCVHDKSKSFFENKYKLNLYFPSFL